MTYHRQWNLSVVVRLKTLCFSQMLSLAMYFCLWSRFFFFFCQFLIVCAHHRSRETASKCPWVLTRCGAAGPLSRPPAVETFISSKEPFLAAPQGVRGGQIVSASGRATGRGASPWTPSLCRRRLSKLAGVLRHLFRQAPSSSNVRKTHCASTESRTQVFSNQFHCPVDADFCLECPPPCPTKVFLEESHRCPARSKGSPRASCLPPFPFASPGPARVCSAAEHRPGREKHRTVNGGARRRTRSASRS